VGAVLLRPTEKQRKRKKIQSVKERQREAGKKTREGEGVERA